MTAIFRKILHHFLLGRSVMGKEAGVISIAATSVAVAASTMLLSADPDAWPVIAGALVCGVSGGLLAVTLPDWIARHRTRREYETRQR